MKYLLLALLLGMSLISCVEKKADQSKVNTPAKKNAIAAKKNNQKGVKKARRPQAKNNQSLQEALKSNANFSQNDIQKINALNAEFQSKLANSTSANKAGISKLKVERLKKAIGEIKYHKLKFLENKQFNINPKNKMDPINLQKNLGLSDAQVYKYIGLMNTKDNAKNRQKNIQELFGMKKFKEFVAYRK